MAKLTIMMKDGKDNVGLDAAVYPSSKKYFCENHKDTPAFALCAHCGKYLCRECGFVMDSKFLCPDCLILDESFNALLSSDSATSEANCSHAKNAITIPEPPKTLKELPHAFHEMYVRGPLFFKTALNTPFGVSFVVAFLSLLPTMIFTVLVYLPKIEEKAPEYAAHLDPAMLEMMKSLNTPTLIFISVLAAALQVLLLDCIYYACVRAFSKTRLTWSQTSSTLHFCLTPLVLCVIAGIAEMEIIYFIALVVMVIKTTAATMITTQSSFLNGLLIMFLFISFVLMLKLV
ncbi:MAG: hypothetical protein IIY06_04400 [Proteobacteria bacterium]|nr:hypothetical protein [Pseudomonadota bacterium]